MAADVVTVSNVVHDRVTGRPAWAVVAGYVMGAAGDPVCVEYRVRQVGAAGDEAEALVDAVFLMERLEEQTAAPDLAPAAPLDRGIPRYVFEEASQGRLLDGARRSLERLDNAVQRDHDARARGEDVGVVRREVSDAERQLLAPAPRRTGRPPARGTLEKLRILAAVEAGTAQGRRLADVADEFEMSRSSLRDLLSWARRDAEPRMFTARGQGRAGGEMTPEARALLVELERG